MDWNDGDLLSESLQPDKTDAPPGPPPKSTTHIYKVKYIQINIHMNKIGMLINIVLTTA